MNKSYKVEIMAQEIISKFWSTLSKVTLKYSRRDGRSEILVREVNDHGHAAAVLAFDPKRKTVLLVKQMRIAAHVAGYTNAMIEVCAGLLDGDDARTCAMREAEEELGIRVHDLREVGNVFMSPGALTERVNLFIGTYSPADRITNGGGVATEGEDIEVLEMTLDEALSAVSAGSIIDAKTIMLIQHLKLETLGAL
jgi:nudix-type nucleoside diphosphatase (YffH/AdpP family)